MIPVLYHFTFNTPLSQALLYAVAAALVAYIAWNGYRGAIGPVDRKTGKPGEATTQQKWQRAALYGVPAVILAHFGLTYALPASAPFAGGRGQGIPIHTYGLLVGGGLLGAITLAARLAESEWRGKDGKRMREKIQDLGFWVFVGGIGGARVLFMIVEWDRTGVELKNLFANFSVGGVFSFLFSGGLVFYGGLIGAILASLQFCRVHGISFMRLADLAIPTVSLGQCLGRLGCFSAGCCWGEVTHAGSTFAVNFPGAGHVKDLLGNVGSTSSLAFSSQLQDARFVIESTGEIFHSFVPGAVRISTWAAQHGTTLPVHPTQMYESIGQFVLFLALMFARRFRAFHGQIFGIWLMAYAVLRSTIELFRGDLERGTLHGLLNWMDLPGLAAKIPAEAWFNVSTSQFISACMFALGATLLARRGAITSRPALPPTSAPAAA